MNLHQRLEHLCRVGLAGRRVFRYGEGKVPLRNRVRPPFSPRRKVVAGANIRAASAATAADKPPFPACLAVLLGRNLFAAAEGTRSLRLGLRLGLLGFCVLTSAGNLSPELFLAWRGLFPACIRGVGEDASQGVSLVRQPLRYLVHC